MEPAGFRFAVYKWFRQWSVEQLLWNESYWAFSANASRSYSRTVKALRLALLKILYNISLWPSRIPPLTAKSAVTITTRLQLDAVRLPFDCSSTLNRSRIVVVTTAWIYVKSIWSFWVKAVRPGKQGMVWTYDSFHSRINMRTAGKICMIANTWSN